jgi:ADP-heptose:LPS heptosyltransferase
MNIRFLRNLDRWLGPVVLPLLAPMVRLFAALLYGTNTAPHGLAANTKACVFLKLKGGGSLIIAMPALLAIRRRAPKAAFMLVCTPEVKAYAELTGIFDRYCLIHDTSPVALASSSLQALKECRRADACIDLEPNSVLAAVFCILTLARQRFGFVKPDERYRASAYTESVYFNLFGPIYVFYDQLAQLLGSSPAPVPECRAQLLLQIHKQTKSLTEILTIGLAPFTSDFAPERMMPAAAWINLIKQELPGTKIRIMIMGSHKNKSAGENLAARIT